MLVSFLWPGQPSPGNSVFDLSSRGSTNLETLGDRPVRQSFPEELPYVLYLFFSKNGAPLPFTAHLPILDKLVVAIVLIGAKEKMVRVDARRVVTSVEYTHAFRNIGNTEIVSHSMSL
jgi:hypothetical protein